LNCYNDIFFSVNIVSILTSFSCYYNEVINPLDLYSNKDPKEYEILLKNLENKIRSIFNPGPEDPNYNIIWNDTDEEDKEDNVYIYIPKDYHKIN
jgi:hypothetical protein